MRALISSKLRRFLTRHTEPRPVRKAPPRARLELGVLEDRLTPAPLLTVTPSRAVYEGDMGVTYADFTANLSGATPAPVTVDWALPGYRPNGPLQQPYSGTLVMNGNSQAQIRIPITGNSIPGNDESYTLKLSPRGNLSHQYPTNFASGSLTIIDDDAQVRFVSDTTANESAGDLRFVVTITKPVGNKVITVNYETRDGTAKAGTDYQTTDGTLTFAPGSTTQTIVVPVINDGIHEGTEAMSVLLTDTHNLATQPYVTSAGRTGVATIYDDDGVPNTAPSITNVADRYVMSGQSTGAIPFVVGDAQTPAGSLMVSAISSDPALVPTSGIVLAGSGANRTVTVTPSAGRTGSATITLQVTDAGGLYVVDTFVLTVTPQPNTPPSISNVTDLSVMSGQSTGAIPFAVGDVQTPAGSLTVSAISSDLALVPASGIVLGGSGANRTVTVTPAAGRTGTATITLQVSDAGGLYVTDTFVLTVTPLPNTSGLRRGPAVYRPSEGNWYLPATPTSGATTQQWGLPGDVPAKGDFDGDNNTDFAVWRPSNGNWYVRTAVGTMDMVQWGLAGDVPVAADYDGDNKTDFAVWRPSEGNWYVYTATGVMSTIRWGLPGDRPVQADYDGDNRIDLAVWRPSNGTWYVMGSRAGIFTQPTWGVAGDIPLPGDYDGDGKADFAVWRPSNGTWWIIRSNDQGVVNQQWGLPGDVPQPGDYDGDGRTDLAVWRPSTGTWYVARSGDGGTTAFQWGLPGDLPVANTQAGILSRMT